MNDPILCWPSSADWLIAQTEKLERIRAERLAQAEADYRYYRKARAIGLRQETLAGFFGEVPAEDMERRFREEAK